MELVVLIGAAVVAALGVLTSRNQTANKALEAAVANQAALNNFFSTNLTQQLSYAEERGALGAQVESLKDDLRTEQDRNRQLVEKTTYDMVESNHRITALQKKIEELEASMLDIRRKLVQVEEEKAALVSERDQLQRAVSEMEQRIDDRVRSAVEKAVQELRDEYESRLALLNDQIRQKDAEIKRLREELQDAKSDTSVGAAGGSVGTAGGAAGDGAGNP